MKVKEIKTKVTHKRKQKNKNEVKKHKKNSENRDNRTKEDRSNRGDIIKSRREDGRQDKQSKERHSKERHIKDGHNIQRHRKEGHNIQRQSKEGHSNERQSKERHIKEKHTKDTSKPSKHNKERGNKDKHTKDIPKPSKHNKDEKTKENRKKNSNESLDDVESDVKKEWEKARLKNISSSERNISINLIYKKMKGKFSKASRRRDFSKLIQSLIKYGNVEIYTNIFEEIKDKIIELTCCRYGRFIIEKFITRNFKIREKIGNIFKKNCKILICDRIGISIFNNLYLSLKYHERNEIIKSLMGNEINLLFNKNKLDEIPIEKIKLNEIYYKITRKGITNYQIAHDIIFYHLKTLNENEQEAVLKELKEFMVDLLHTRSGIKISDKILLKSFDKKEILKNLKPYFNKIVMDSNGVIFYLRVMSICNEKDLQKYFYKNLRKNFKELFLHKNSSLLYFYILNKEKKYFPMLFNEIQSENEIINFEANIFNKSNNKLESKEEDSKAKEINDKEIDTNEINDSVINSKETEVKDKEINNKVTEVKDKDTNEILKKETDTNNKISKNTTAFLIQKMEKYVLKNLKNCILNERFIIVVELCKRNEEIFKEVIFILKEEINKNILNDNYGVMFVAALKKVMNLEIKDIIDSKWNERFPFLFK
ncbi:hypothetical protein CWI38_1243p0030 [Hamiltosporidium tvaerminnensis]|uniref:PUM-HD domain-containing protein n=1 Tax=Hamiltosporidium tvaerminnensis TaxID=1176355 RepID=A0A4V2JXD4_9MICR|nr:hypothetical protein CWI38_1243p0030 [Hamiltosporidium tvaerminnensis]